MNVWNKLRSLCFRLRVEQAPDMWVPVTQASADLRIHESIIRRWGKAGLIRMERMPKHSGRLVYAVNLREVQQFNKARMIPEIQQ